jgi:transcriptional regulator with XRE-family HTH domain
MKQASVYPGFGPVLRQRRQAAGLSLRELAMLTGHQRTHIGLVERGLRNASLAFANDLARALGTSLSQMIIQAEKEGQRS